MARIIFSILIATALSCFLYFQPEALKEPEGASLEIASEKKEKEELKLFLKLTFVQTAFLPKIKEVPLPPPPKPKPKIVKEKATEFQNLASRVIEINLKSQTLSRWENGQKMDTFRISTGKRGYRTPTGTFSVKNKYSIAYSRKYHLYMPYWMAFYDGYGIHELPYWRGGLREGSSHLGRPVSHGCVRLGVGPAAALYHWASVGVPVVIHY